MNTFSFLEKAALYRGDQTAIIYGNERTSYAEFREHSLTIAGNLLQLGLSAGDRVAFCMANNPRILEVIYACFAAGLVVVPINARLHPKEMAYILDNSGAKVFIHGSEYHKGIVENIAVFPNLTARVCFTKEEGTIAFDELLDSTNSLNCAVEIEGDEPCWLFYTSGTTGKPKGAIWSHRIIRVVCMNYLADLHNIQPGEMVLHAAPLSHGSGIAALPAIARGATNAIYDQTSFDPKSLFETVERLSVSHIAFLAPTQIIKMLEDYRADKFDLSSLKAICYGGAPIHVEHLKKAMKTFGPIFIQLYGQGESPITISGMTSEQHKTLLAANDPRIGSTGTIRTDVEVRIVNDNDENLPQGEIGEITVRGDVIMQGYWNMAEATANTIRQGWLHTGDIGMFDDKGYLYLLDRSKDVVITGGNNVYPREVEEVIMQLPGVVDAVVLGIPDDYWGEAVHAVIIKEPRSDITAKDVIDHCSNSLAGYKKPKGVDFVTEFPISGYGKILRREIRAEYWKNHEKTIGGSVKLGTEAQL